MVLITHPSRPFNTLDSLLEQMRRPGGIGLSVSHRGLATVAHLAAPDVQARVGAKWLELPYKGIAFAGANGLHRVLSERV